MKQAANAKRIDNARGRHQGVCDIVYPSLLLASGAAYRKQFLSPWFLLITRFAHRLILPITS